MSAPAFAQAAYSAGELERGYGMENDSWDWTINPSTRDANGNRVIVNGRFLADGTSLSGGLQDEGFMGSATAVGNQLNVVTQGNWNTVIIDSTQINNGDISANVDGD